MNKKSNIPEGNILANLETEQGESVVELSQNQTVLLIFLRHFGCTFCRESLADLGQRRKELADKNIKIVLVHMSTPKIAEPYFEKYQLTGESYICDPKQNLYRGFGLTKGSFHQLFGLSTWIRGFEAGVIEGHGIGPQLGDGFQMPGVFVIRDGEVVQKFIHSKASDRPDYIDLASCCD